MCDLLTDIELGYTNQPKIILLKMSIQKRFVLESFLTSEVKRVMGDTEINLDSSEDRSRVIFSREVLDKKRWAMIFNLGYEDRGNADVRKDQENDTCVITKHS